jgi:acetamidase/formamidase
MGRMRGAAIAAIGLSALALAAAPAHAEAVKAPVECAACKPNTRSFAVSGAFFSVGDPHAAQGDRELGGTAIETSLTGDFEFILHKQSELGGTLLEGLEHPMLETEELWSVYGFTYPNYLAALGPDARTVIAGKSSLDPAMRDAFRKLRRFLMTVHRLSEDEAIALLSVAADFGVTQVVDANWGIHGSIRKSMFTDR